MPYLVMGLAQGTGAATAHRYWRFIITGINNNPTPGPNDSRQIVSEVEMAESAAGADVTTTGFAIGSEASPTLNGYAFNNITGISAGAYWEANPRGTDALGSWVGQDFGAGNEKQIVEVRVFAYNFGDYITPDMDVQYSDNGTSWTTLGSTNLAGYTSHGAFNTFTF